MVKKEKCILCENEIETTLLDKPIGTFIKIKTEDKNEKYLVCADCQKKHKDNTKKEIEKLFKK